MQKNLSEKPLVLLLLGPPGSGKGTQAGRLSKELGIPHISTGDLFRDHIQRGTALGVEAKKYIDKGRLGPDELVFDMLFDRIARSDCQKGYLLDGFPRTIPQAEVLEEYLKDKAHLKVVALAVPDEALIKRISGRLSCKNCHQLYHTEFAPPQSKGVCDKCGGDLYQRTDDKEDVVRERLRVYHQQTEPVLHFYKAKGFIDEVNGMQTSDQVFAQLKQIIQAST